METKTAFIFDCDGVLLDSIGAWHDLDQRLAEEAGIVMTAEDRKALNASTLVEAAAYFHNHYGVGESVSAVEDRFTRFLLDYYENEASETPGALAFVRMLASTGMPLCVLSSSPQAFLVPGLERAGFSELIGTVLSAEDLPFKKRNAQLYPHVCEMLGTTPQNTWFFDDSWYALEAASAAGMRNVGVHSFDACGTREQLGRFAEMVCDSLAELPQEPTLWVAGAPEA